MNERESKVQVQRELIYSNALLTGHNKWTCHAKETCLTRLAGGRTLSLHSDEGPHYFRINNKWLDTVATKTRCISQEVGTFPVAFVVTNPNVLKDTMGRFLLGSWRQNQMVLGWPFCISSLACARVSVLMDKVISDLRYSCAWTLEKGKRGIQGKTSLRAPMELICCNVSYKGNTVNTLSQLWCEGEIRKITPHSTSLLQGSSSCHNKTVTYITCNPNGAISDTSPLIVFKPLGSSGGGTQPGSFLASDMWQINF